MKSAATPTTSREHALKALDDYVGWIDRLCGEPGARAALRRGLRRTPDQAVTMHRYVAPWTESKDPDDEWAYYTVAALMANRPPATRQSSAPNTAEMDDRAGATTGDSDPSLGEGSKKPTRRPNLGETLAGLGGDPDRADRTERRLHLLVRQQVPGIQRQLPGVIRYLASARVAPDWGVLLHDLMRWRTSHDRVCREWLQAYYRTRALELHKSASSPNEPSGE